MKIKIDLDTEKGKVIGAYVNCRIAQDKKTPVQFNIERTLAVCKACELHESMTTNYIYCKGAS